MRPSVKLLAVTRPVVDFLHKPEDIIEYAGRWDYGPKSIAKLGDPTIIERWIAAGEESMLEMVDAVFLIECSRVVSHELVRHRIASYQQESQRYVAYEDESRSDLFFAPGDVQDVESVRAIYDEALLNAHDSYKQLREKGVKKQIARYVLPNATRTRIVVKMNLREWRHVIRLRTHKSAQPEMQDVMSQVFDILRAEFPRTFGPLVEEIESGKRSPR